MSSRPPLLLRHRSVLPGFHLSLGVALLYMGLIVLLPLAAVFATSSQLGWERFVSIATGAQVVASYRLTFGASLMAALLNTAMGLLVAWVVERYRFPGRRFVDAMVDLPFALPTAVAGVALTGLYAPNGWIGRWLPFQVAYTPLGVMLALTFIGLPFVLVFNSYSLLIEGFFKLFPVLGFRKSIFNRMVDFVFSLLRTFELLYIYILFTLTIS